MLTRAQKAAVVSELADKFRRQRVLMFADIRGIGVAHLSAFRRELKNLGAEFKVAKKTLLQRALAASGLLVEGMSPRNLEGEIGVVFGYEDQIAPAKALAKFAKENETFKVLKGAIAGKLLEAGEVLALAKLPPREHLLGQLARALGAPIQGLATALGGNIRGLAVVLTRIADKK